MSIAWVDGAENAATIFSGSLTLTVPSDVASGDVVFIMATAQPLSGSSYPTVSVTSSKTAPQQVGSDLHQAGSFTTHQLWWFVAGASDASATISVTPSLQAHTGISLGAWSGAAASSQPDVVQPGVSSGAVNPFPAPSATTVSNGDWAVYFAGVTGGAVLSTPPSGSTSRETDGNSSTSIADSNASVGAGGTSIGGGNWTANAGAYWGGFTIGLAPSATPGPVFRQKTFPVRAKNPLHPRAGGLVASNQRTPAYVPPVPPPPPPPAAPPVDSSQLPSILTTFSYM